MTPRKLSLLIFICFVAAIACRKESLTSSPSYRLEFSEDSVFFDTVFTTTGSATKLIKIFNRNDRKILIDNIRIAGGTASAFAFNADGWLGPEVRNIELNSTDSIYLFVSVNTDPEATDLPFIIEDSLYIAYNSKEEVIKFSAWGQNAHFLRSHVITSDTTWNNTLPIVVTGGVLIAENVKLTITKGARIFLHADAPVIVDGTIDARGEKYDSTKIIFTGDRIDPYYRDLPGSWPGIYFRETSIGNVLKHVILKNAYQAVVAEKHLMSSAPKVTLEETIIDNSYDAGILALASNIYAVNCLVSNSGKNIVLARGGKYSFIHSTVAAISTNYIAHQQPVLTVTDYVKSGDDLLFGDVDATFTNCIFWGSDGVVEDEVVVLKEGGTDFNVSFNNCLWKVKTAPENCTISDVVLNADPLFVLLESTTNTYNFRLKEGSPAINAGTPTSVSNDLDNKARTGNPDIGAFESSF